MCVCARFWHALMFVQLVQSAAVKSSPRITCIIARRAPIALVIWRASGWSHLARWHLATDQIEHGAWAHKRVVTHKGDLSDDGVLCSIHVDGVFHTEQSPRFVKTASQQNFKGFSIVSRAPWLHPLWSQEERGALGCGFCFDDGDPTCAKGSSLTVQVDSQPVALRFLDSQYQLRDLRRGWTLADPMPNQPPYLDREPLAFAEDLSRAWLRLAVLLRAIAQPFASEQLSSTILSCRARRHKVRPCQRLMG
jgi:hypothetical protein